MSGLLRKTVVTVRSLLHEMAVAMCVTIRPVQSVAVACRCRDSRTVHRVVGRDGPVQSLLKAVIEGGGIL